jgi:hypothetical protein
MSPNPAVLSCPHCGQSLLPFSLPDEAAFESPFQLACFNDDCPYYVRGWTWMEEQFGVKSSYRCRIDPATGRSSPVPVWSPSALRDRILEADVGVAPCDDADANPAQIQETRNEP